MLVGRLGVVIITIVATMLILTITVLIVLAIVTVLLYDAINHDTIIDTHNGSTSNSNTTPGLHHKISVFSDPDPGKS